GAGGKINGDVGGFGERRGRRIGDGDGVGAVGAGRAGHADDVGTLAGLRNGDGGGLLQLQFAAVDRHDGGADRGHRQAGGELDGVFEKQRGVIGRAARDGGDEERLALAQGGAGFGENRT